MTTALALEENVDVGSQDEERVGNQHEVEPVRGTTFIVRIPVGRTKAA